MTTAHIDTISIELGIASVQVAAVTNLLDAEASVPFIARYRKEATGSLDEVAVTAIRDRLLQLRELDARRASILKSLEERGLLDPELAARLQAAPTLSSLEDLYLPFRPKRRTRAASAREKGLAPLAAMLMAQSGCDPLAEAAAFVDAGKGVASIDETLAGARDIIAEQLTEDATVRARLRALYAEQASLRSCVAAGKEHEGAKYRDYFDWQEPLATAPSHRVLAMRRGEREDVLNLNVSVPEPHALALLETLIIRGQGADSEQVRMAMIDGFRRLLARTMETEMRLAAKERADLEAIRIFASNLRELLMAPPLGPRRVMAIDPGFRTGCKLVCLDAQGRLLHHDTVHPHGSPAAVAHAAATLRQLVERFQIEAVAVGNGTAGRETEAFVRNADLPAALPVVMVSESGASIYSASDLAREEFPDLDLTVRGAASIGRRLMDPLAELVKIDPKSIGVGQYQHDVDQGALKQALDDVVVSCVNSVGVDVNRASAQLLTYVSGLGPQLARNIVAYRDAHGPFGSRSDLRRVPRLGPKAFEQAAGFLRIHGGTEPLDASAVHPESYSVVAAMAADLQCQTTALLADAALRRRIDPARYVCATVGLPTLHDILAELERPGRDPRQRLEPFAFASHVTAIEDLRPGMRLPGIVTNVTAFGAFIDIGVHQDGLAHVSQLADRFVKNPAEVVKVQQRVTVTVLEVDLERRRIALSLRRDAGRSIDRIAAAPVAPQAGVPRPQPCRERSRNAARPFHNPFGELLRPRG
jgi:uncharacterized protein